MLPGTDGFSICRAVRAQKDIPILMVTTLGKDADKIHGLGFGAAGAVTLGGVAYNLVLATLGNIVGGLLVGLAYWFIYRKKQEK